MPAQGMSVNQKHAGGMSETWQELSGNMRAKSFLGARQNHVRIGPTWHSIQGARQNHAMIMQES